jgi:hypothetical protein
MKQRAWQISSTILGLTVMVDLDGSKEKLETWIEKLTAINNILGYAKAK